MQSVTTAMARADTPQEALEALLERLGEDMGWDVGRVLGGGRRRRPGPRGRLGRRPRRRVGVRAPQPSAAPRARRRAARPGPGAPRDRSGSRTTPPTRACCEPAPRAPRACIRRSACPRRARARSSGSSSSSAPSCGSATRPVVGALATVGGHIGELLGVLDERHALLRRLETARPHRPAHRPAQPPRVGGDPGPRAGPGRPRRPARCASRSSISTASSATTTSAATWPATRCSARPPRPGAPSCAAATCWPATAATSSPRSSPGRALDTAVVVVERLRRAAPEGCTCSAGVAMWDGAESATDLFGRADAALYVAKQSGRDQLAAASCRPWAFAVIARGTSTTTWEEEVRRCSGDAGDGLPAGL